MVYKNLIHQAFMSGVTPLFFRSSCIYLKLAEQLMTVDTLLNEKLEPTNKHYAIAKIAGLKMYESYNRQYGKAMGWIIAQ
jgi:GDP-L-fucose synthase